MASHVNDRSRKLDTLDSLPNELLSTIFSFLETSEVSEARLDSNPAQAFSSPDCQPLKAVSLVNSRWRSVSLEHLFRHTLWRVSRQELQQLENIPAHQRHDTVGLLTFLHDRKLDNHVRHFTLVVNDKPTRKVSKDIILSDYATEKFVINDADMNWLWDTLFQHLNPLRFTIVASPKTLAWLFSRMVWLGDEWCFNVAQHVVSLSREHRHLPLSSRPEALSLSSGSTIPSFSTSASFHTPPSSSPQSSTSSRKPARPRSPCNLFTIKPWTSVLLNEGSSSRVYQVYESSLKRPPSVLGALLGCEEPPNDIPLISPAVRSFSYICHLPLTNHLNAVIRNLPRVDKVYFRLAYDTASWPRSSGPRDSYELGMLLELYRMVMRATFGRRAPITSASANWRFLKELESGDTDINTAMELFMTRMLAEKRKLGWQEFDLGLFRRHETDRIPNTDTDSDSAENSDLH